MGWGDARIRKLSDSHQTVFRRLSGSGEDIMTSKQEVVIQGGCVTSKRGHHKLSFYEQILQNTIWVKFDSLQFKETPS